MRWDEMRWQCQGGDGLEHRQARWDEMRWHDDVKVVMAWLMLWRVASWTLSTVFTGTSPTDVQQPEAKWIHEWYRKLLSSSTANDFSYCFRILTLKSCGTAIRIGMWIYVQRHSNGVWTDTCIRRVTVINCQNNKWEVFPLIWMYTVCVHSW